MAPAATTSTCRPRTSTRRDQLTEYLNEPLNNTIGVMEYWQRKQTQWPELVVMALDLLAVPAMSSECKRVFSSCAKMTTPDSRKLLGTTLWHHQCLKNWYNQGAINLAQYRNRVELALDSDDRVWGVLLHVAILWPYNHFWEFGHYGVIDIGCF